MVTLSKYKHVIFFGLALLALAMIFTPSAIAQEHAEEAASTGGASVGDGLRAAGLALGAGIAIAGGALGTGRAQAGVGAGGTGAVTEKPELFANILILFAIPETLVVLAFVVAILLLNSI